MQDVCIKCGGKYKVRSFRLAFKVCPDCAPGLVDLYAGSKDGTEEVFKFMVGVQMLLFFLSFGSLAFACEVIFALFGLYTATIFFYVVLRALIAAIKGFPILSKFQVAALLLLPVWGLAEFAGLFIIVRLLTRGGI